MKQEKSGEKIRKLKIQLSKEVQENDYLGEMSGELTGQDLIEFGDILESAISSLQGRIKTESTLFLELTGQIRLEDSAGAEAGLGQLIVLKVSGNISDEKTNTMKIAVETRITPKDSPEA